MFTGLLALRFPNKQHEVFVNGALWVSGSKVSGA